MREVDAAEAYRKLDRILARDEYQDYVSPIGWIVQAFTWFSDWFSGLSLPLQIVFIAVLTAILAAILAHFLTVLRKISRAGKAVAAQAQHVLTIAGLPGSARLRALADEALRRGDRAAALRLWYLTVVARLREKGRIPLSTALTGREIIAATLPPLAGLQEATRSFERCVYGARTPGDEEIGFVERLWQEVG